MEKPELFTYTEAAEILRISPANLRKLVFMERVPAHSIGGRIVFTVSDLHSAVLPRKKPATSRGRKGGKKKVVR